MEVLWIAMFVPPEEEGPETAREAQDSRSATWWVGLSSVLARALTF